MSGAHIIIMYTARTIIQCLVYEERPWPPGRHALTKSCPDLGLPAVCPEVAFLNVLLLTLTGPRKHTLRRHPLTEQLLSRQGGHRPKRLLQSYHRQCGTAQVVGMVFFSERSVA